MGLFGFEWIKSERLRCLTDMAHGANSRASKLEKQLGQARAECNEAQSALVDVETKLKKSVDNGIVLRDRLDAEVASLKQQNKNLRTSAANSNDALKKSEKELSDQIQLRKDAQTAWNDCDAELRCHKRIIKELRDLLAQCHQKCEEADDEKAMAYQLLADAEDKEKAMKKEIKTLRVD